MKKYIITCAHIYTLESLKWNDISVPNRDRQGWTQFNSKGCLVLHVKDFCWLGSCPNQSKNGCNIPKDKAFIGGSAHGNFKMIHSSELPRDIVGPLPKKYFYSNGSLPDSSPYGYSLSGFLYFLDQ